MKKKQADKFHVIEFSWPANKKLSRSIFSAIYEVHDAVLCKDGLLHGYLKECSDVIRADDGTFKIRLKFRLGGFDPRYYNAAGFSIKRYERFTTKPDERMKG